MYESLLNKRKYESEELQEAAVIVHPKIIENYGVTLDKIWMVFEEGSNFTQLQNPIIDEFWNKFWDSEWFYMAQRFSNPDIKWFIAFCSQWKGLSKKAAYEFKNEITNHPEDRIEAMRLALREKFMRNLELQRVLLATGRRDIIELTFWGDDFFGIKHDTMIGANILGKLLVETRERILQQL